MEENRDITQPVNESTVTEQTATPVQQNDAPESIPQYNAGFEVAEQPAKKSMVPLFIILGISVVLIGGIIAALLNYNYLYAKIAPQSYSLKAATKAADVFADRLDTTPFAIYNSAVKASTDGNMELDMSASYDDGGIEEKIAADISLSRKTETKQNQLNLDVDFLGVAANANIYADDTYAAFNTSLFGDGQSYGLDYKDAAKRINDKFELGMSDEEIEDTQMSIDSMANSSDFDITNYDKSFLSLRDKFLEVMKADVSYETTSLNSEQVKCIAVKYTISKEDLIMLLNEYLEIVKNDEDIKEAIGMYPAYFGEELLPTDYEEDYSDMTTYDIYLSKLEDFIDDVDTNYEGTINIDLYSNKSGCLVKVIVSGDYSYYDEDMAEWDDAYEADTTYYLSTLDLGKAPELSYEYTYQFCYSDDEDEVDKNELYICMTEDENTETNYSSEIEMTSSYYNEYDEETSTDKYFLETSWDKTTGDLVLTASENNSYSDAPTTYKLSGTLKLDGDNAEVNINDVQIDDGTDEDSQDITFNYTLKFTQGATITPPDSYKELDDWTDDDISGMESGFQDFILRIYLGDSYDDYMMYY